MLLGHLPEVRLFLVVVQEYVEVRPMTGLVENFRMAESGMSLGSRYWMAKVLELDRQNCRTLGRSSDFEVCWKDNYL